MNRFSEFRQDWNPVCSLDKNPSLVFVTFKQYLNWTPNDIRWLKPEREKQGVCCGVACCLEWFERESTESLTHVCVFVEKPLGSFDRDRFCFGFQGTT